MVFFNDIAKCLDKTTALSMLLHEKIAEAKVVDTFPKVDCQGQIALMKY